MADSPQDERTYRRGMVMGLTMAEIMLLILFVLLLFFGVRAREMAKKETASKALNTPTLEELAAAVGIPQQKILDDFKVLVLVTKRAAEIASTLGPEATPGQVDTLLGRVDLAREVVEGLGPNTVGAAPEVAARQFVGEAAERYKVEKAGHGYGSSSIWMGSLEPKAAGGPGGDLPPCARSKDGKPALVMTATLYDLHLELVDRDMDSVQQTAPGALGSFQHIDRAKPLTDTEFLTQTSQVFAWSVAQKCRFFVYVDDKTGNGSKAVYKQRLRTVEGHFYKFLG